MRFCGQGLDGDSYLTFMTLKLLLGINNIPNSIESKSEPPLKL
jgi:hypothetical protein